MAQSLEEVVEAARSLPMPDRIELMAWIGLTIERPKASPDPAWSAELKHRYDAHVSGEEPGIPWEEVCRQIELQLDEEDDSDA